ncbi:hypothetical protein M9Y10_024054 [Tritrichomonas musculus]|uniref:DUF4201 domain-containing protein n=1 Tax=Tritrichomonas musculus TaxID=1915356 RepID=A0ABR2KWV3_9EUKA
MNQESDGQKSGNLDKEIIEKSSEQSDLNKNENKINDHSEISSSSVDQSFDINTNNNETKNSTKQLEPLSVSVPKKNEITSSNSNGDNIRVHKPYKDQSKDSSPRSNNASNKKSEDINSASNSKEEQKQGKMQDKLSNSSRVITTIDSERPPSGYSEYSFSYEYSDDEIEKSSYHSQTQSSQKARRKKKVQPRYNKYIPPTVNISTEELEILKKKAINLEPLEDLDDDTYEVLVLSLAEDRKNYAISNDFQQSELLNSAIDHVTEAQLEQRKYILQQKTYEQYKEQMINVQSELELYDAETEQKLMKLYETIDIQRKNLQQLHDRQIQLLNDQWTSKKKERQYNHASPRLLFLRKQFQQLKQQCRFKEAAEVKTQITNMEKKEEYEAMRAMQHNFDESMNKTLKKQNEELALFESRSKLQIKKLKQEREKERSSIDNKESKLKNMEENIGNPEKLWNRAQMKRTVDISKGKMKDAKVSPKISAKEFNQKEETTIKLPKLKIRKKITRPAL